MQRIIVALIGLVLISATGISHAGHNKHWGYKSGAYYDRHYHKGYLGHNGYRGAGHFRAHRHHHRYRGYRRSNDDVAWLLGGLVIGSVITNAYHHHSSYHRDRSYGARYHRDYPPEREVIYRTRTTTRSVNSVLPGRHFYRDLEGNCYQITTNSEGEELREARPAKECDW